MILEGFQSEFEMIVLKGLKKLEVQNPLMSLENDFGDDGRIIDIDFRVSKWGRGHFGSFATWLILWNLFWYKIPKYNLIFEWYMYLKWFNISPVFSSRVLNWLTKWTKVSYVFGPIDLLIDQLIDCWFPILELEFDSSTIWIFKHFQIEF